MTKRKAAIEIVNTGIFSERRVVNPPNKRELESITKWFKDNGSLEGQISYYEKSAKGILRKHGIADADLIVVCQKITEAMRSDPENLNLRDAGTVLCHAESVRRYVSEGKAERAAMHAMQLTNWGMKLEIRQHEKPAKTGRAALANLDKGRKNGQDRYNDARERHFDWHERSLKMKGTSREIADAIAAQTGDNSETIRKALQKFRNKK